MKVTFATREDENVSGGQNTWLCRFLPKLLRHGIEPRVLCFTGPAKENLPMIRSLRRSGIHCATFSQVDHVYTEKQTAWILEQVVAHPAEVFVCNMVIPPAYYAGRWLRQAGIPTVGVCHGGGMSHLYVGLLDQFVFGSEPYRVSAFVTVSDFLAQDVRRKNPTKLLLRRIPCGVAVPKEITPKPNDRMRLVYFGQLIEERKRISETTRALCRAVREIEGTEAYIYGDGPDRQTVERILADEGRGLAVYLVGFIENHQLRQRLQHCHAVVLLSDHEGLGLSLLEGMACGLVPIGLRGAPGLTEFVIDNVTGLLVSDRDDDFVAAVRRLRKDPALWERLSRSARAQVQTEYSDEVCIARWLKLFRELRDRSGPLKPLRIPPRLRLPSVHPALAEVDKRLPPPHTRIIARTRSFLTGIKPRIFRNST